MRIIFGNNENNSFAFSLLQKDAHNCSLQSSIITS